MEEYNIDTTVLTQYQKSQVLLALIDTLKYVDPYLGVNQIYDKIFNINTANSYGLDIWGLILNVSRYVKITSTQFFGFNGTGFSPFDNFPFFDDKISETYRLDDDAYRSLLMLSASRDTSNASLSELNRITATLFGDRGTCKVEKDATMHLTFTFDFAPENYEIGLLQNENIVPVPTGVDYDIIINV